MDITISSYGRYSSDNYGANTIKVSIGRLTLWFSYQTLVAFQMGWENKVVCRNVWTTTTGKHLNWIDGGRKEDRVSPDEFNATLQAVMAECGLAELPAVRV